MNRKHEVFIACADQDLQEIRNACFDVTQEAGFAAGGFLS
jgi:hypothetical protein